MSPEYERLENYFRKNLFNDFRRALSKRELCAAEFIDYLRSILTRDSESTLGGVYISPLESACIPFLRAVGLLEEREIRGRTDYFLTDKARDLIEKN